ncbi:MAG: SpoIID/LytB domain-containing protein [Phycisphaeraceae bacterium]
MFKRIPFTFVRFAVGAALCVLLGSCQDPAETPAPAPAPRDRTVPLESARAIGEEPTIRVRIAAEAAAVTAGGGPTVLVRPVDVARGRQFRAPVRVTRADGAFVLSTGAGDFRWTAGRLHLEGVNGRPVTIEGTRYPGAVVLVPLQYRGRETGHFDVINHVSLETYLPGVIERELWPRWEAAAFEAQAIAARSYALFERRMNSERHYDLSSTTSSQVYGGAGSNATALAAVRATRGQVLTYDGRVLPAFYSSCCGGTSQSAAVAFARLGRGVDLPPLRSRQRPAWCAPSRHHRWGPITRRASVLAQRMARWGRDHEHAIAQLRGLRRINVTARSEAGRPAQFTVTDARGRRYTLWAEQFRFACNHAVTGLPELAFDEQLRSSHVQPTVHGGMVRFTGGRGWGHGVGMCQWGAQGMATHGYDGRTILRQFYPEADVQRVY